MLHLVDAARAQVRYRVWTAALIAVLVLPLVGAVGVAGSAAQFWSDNASDDAVPLFSVPGGWWTSGEALIVLWTSWIIASALRLVHGAHALWRARRNCRRVPEELEARLFHWTRVK